MPILSTFFGIIVRMFHDDHNPPHVHVEYAEYTAIVEIKSGRVISGGLPIKALKLLQEWRRLHLLNLMKAWEDVHYGRVPKKIKPLE